MRKVYKKTLKYVFSICPFLKIRISLLRSAGYQIGQDVYVPRDLQISDLSSSRHNVAIRDRVSIGPGVILVTDAGPNNSRLKHIFTMKSGSVVLESDVWLGAGVIVMPGVRVGQCSVMVRDRSLQRIFLLFVRHLVSLPK